MNISGRTGINYQAKFLKMRNILIITLLFSFCAVAIGQETKFYKKNINVDSVITIDGYGLREYLSLNIRFPIDASEDNIMGTYIGCIRLDNKGKLIKAFTVNSLGNSIDSEFTDLIKKTWAKNKVVVSNISDTTDLFIPIQYKMSNGNFLGTYDYHVDTELAPSFISPGIVAVSISTNGTTRYSKDEVFIDKANEYFKDQKFNKCIKPLSELIRRNPYNTDLIVMRGLCYDKLGKKELECRDYKYLRYFLQSSQYKKLTNCE